MTTLTKSQMMREVAGGRLRETFTHTTLGTFDITALRATLREMKKLNDRRWGPHTVTFDVLRADGHPELSHVQVVEWIAGQREIDEARVLELSPSQINEPIINTVDTDGAHYPIDGIHRLVRRARMGLPGFRFWAVPLVNCPRPAPGLYADVPWGQMDVRGDRLVPRAGSVVSSSNNKEST